MIFYISCDDNQYIIAEYVRAGAGVDLFGAGEPQNTGYILEMV